MKKRLSSLVFLFLMFAVGASAASVVLNATNFPDETFRARIAYLWKFYGFGETSLRDGESFDPARFKKLQVYGYDHEVPGAIENMTGIHYFTELTYLDCSDNKISSLNLSSNTKLAVVKCYGNNIGMYDMVSLVLSLPYNNDGELWAIAPFNTREGNDIRKDQVEKAGDRGWTVYFVDEDDVENEYEGSEIKQIDFLDQKYTTCYYGEYLLKLPEGLRGATIDNAEGTLLTLNYRYEGDVQEKCLVPVATAVILRGEPEELYSVLAMPVGSEYKSSPMENMLRGTDEDEETSEGDDYLYYKLSWNSDHTHFGFYWGAPTGGSFVNRAHKAYLISPTMYGAREIVGFELDGDELTGIAGVDSSASSDSDACYTIDGRRIDGCPTQPGLYVSRGRKMLVR